MTLREMITMVIDGLNRPFDIMLYNRIKPMIISEAAYLVKQQATKYGQNLSYMTELIVPVIVDGNGMKSVSKVPVPLRLNNGSLFYYVGSKNGKVPYDYADIMQNHFLCDVTHRAKAITYDYIGGYLTLAHTKFLDEVKIRAQFPITVIDKFDTAESDNQVTDDDIFPIPSDLENVIVDKIISSPKLSITDNRDKVEAGHLDNV